MARDAYATRNRRKAAKGQGCMITLIVGGSLFAGLSVIATEAARWLS